MRILFLAVPKSIATGAVKPPLFKSPPITFVWLSAFLKQARHEPEILDGYSLGLTEEQIFTRIAIANPDMVGFTSFTCEFSDIMYLIRRLRNRFPRIRIIVGGYHANSLPRDFFCDAIDYVLSGEAEQTLPRLLTRLEQGGGELSDIAGLHHRHPESGTWISNPTGHYIPNFNHTPLLPYEMVANNGYTPWWTSMDARTEKYMATVTGKGCPMTCSFCDISKTEGARYRAMDAERTVRELAHLHHDFGITHVEIRDPYFTIDLKRVAAIAQMLIDRNIRLNWGFSSTIHRIKDLELLRLLRRAGCGFIFFGVESGNRAILKREKKVTPEQVIDVVRMTRKAGIFAHCGFILGLEGETEESIRETIDLAINCRPDAANFTIAVPYPGTELFQSFKEKNYLKTFDWKEYRQDNPVFETEHLNREQLIYWLEQSHRQFFFRPAYLIDRLWHIRSWRQFKVHARIGISMFFKTLSYKS
ncbi:MAG: radical SAM protein [Magnetococcales bacterium]|nr:radical SAM protein [Magnetococcales bacterium]